MIRLAILALLIMPLVLALQPEKRPLEEQKFLEEIPPNAESLYFFVSKLFEKGGINHQWEYRDDQCLDNPERTDPRPPPLCDLDKPPEDQSQQARSVVSDSRTFKAATLLGAMSAIQEAANSRRQWLSEGRDKYTGFAPGGSDEMHKGFRHLMATFCEKPDDPFFTERPALFSGMPQHLDNMAVALAPKYQAQILNHIENGEYDGRKIHPRGVHPDCKLSKGD